MQREANKAALGLVRLKPERGHYFRSSKTYNHSIGLSCCFRQWRANSHCNLLHGYALKVHLEWESSFLDERNWVQDFGDLKAVKTWLEEQFDHKTLIAKDDPKLILFRELEIARLIDLKVVEHVGVEAFAKMIFDHVSATTDEEYFDGQRKWLRRVVVSEHDGNCAEYGRKDTL